MTDRRPGTRTRADVVGAALALVDADGADALSMRRVAGRLGVTAMALYNHVRGRDDLVGGVVDHVLEGMDLPDAGGPWRPRLRTVFIALRRVYLAHPNVVTLIHDSATVSDAQLRPMETALQALADAGLSTTQAREAWTTLIGLTNGHVAYQLQGHFADVRPDRPAPLGLRRFPRVAAAVTTDHAVDYGAAFETALDALIDGLLPRAAPRRGGPAGEGRRVGDRLSRGPADAGPTR